MNSRWFAKLMRWLLSTMSSCQRGAFLIAFSAIPLGFAHAQPAEFYAYSPPFHGYQMLLISDLKCETGARGLSEELRSRFAVDTPPNDRAWKNALTVTPRDGSFGSCWIEVTKERQPALISCVLSGPREFTKDCMLFARQSFRKIDRRR